MTEVEKIYRERLASLCHEQWSGWMKYLFSQCRDKDGGGKIINLNYYLALKRQMNTPYTELDEEEKENDRMEADKFISLFNNHKQMVEPKKTEEVNEYALMQFKRDFSSPEDKEGTQKFQKVTFYKLNDDGSYDNGTTLEEMLKISIERLKNLNSRFTCRENKNAIIKMEEALMWLNERTKNREKRGVEGKHLA